MNIPIPWTGSTDGHRKWRTALIVRSKPFLAAIATQVQHPGSDRWGDLHASGWWFWAEPSWEWGEDHLYYDGPHCRWAFGWLRVVRGGNWQCKECVPHDG